MGVDGICNGLFGIDLKSKKSHTRHHETRQASHGMTVIRNKFFPFPGYKAINLFGILFAKPKAKLDELTVNHESVHSKQFKEVTLSLATPVLLLSYYVSWWWIALIPFTFYLWYVIEFLIRWTVTSNWDESYRNISFEREAYENDEDLDYLKNRKLFAFIKYIK